MRTPKLLSFVIGGAILFALTGHAQSEPGLGADMPRFIEWQALTLEKQIKERLSSEISHLVPQTHFLVGATVRIKQGDSPRVRNAPKAEMPLLLNSFTEDQPLALRDRSQDSNLFNFIDTVSITVWLDQGIGVEQESVIRLLAKDVLSFASLNKVDIKVKKIDLTNQAAKFAAEKEKKVWTFEKVMDYVRDMSVGLGLLVASLLASFVVFVAIWSIRKVYSRHVDAMENATRAKHAPRKEEKPIAPPVPTRSATTPRPLEEFTALIINDPMRAASLLRSLMASNNSESRNLLSVLLMKISRKSLENVVNKLSEGELRKWREGIGNVLNDREIKDAENLMGAMLLKISLSAATPLDAEMQEFFETLRPEAFKQISEEFGDIAPFLMCLMPSEKIGEVLSALSPLEGQMLTDRCERISRETILSRMDEIRQIVTFQKSRETENGSNPFIENAAELIEQLGIEREGLVFSVLARAGKKDLLKAAMQKCPWELFASLPTEILRGALMPLASFDRSVVVAHVSPDLQFALLNSLGSEGNLHRAAVEADLQLIKQNPQLLRQRHVDARGVRGKFIQAARTAIRNAQLVQVEELVESWCDARMKLASTNSGEGNDGDQRMAG